MMKPIFVSWTRRNDSHNSHKRHSSLSSVVAMMDVMMILGWWMIRQLPEGQPMIRTATAFAFSNLHQHQRCHHERLFHYHLGDSSSFTMTNNLHLRRRLDGRCRYLPFKQFVKSYDSSFTTTRTRTTTRRGGFPLSAHHPSSNDPTEHDDTSTSSSSQPPIPILPQVISTACSQKSLLVEAVQEATERALLGLPNNNNNIDDQQQDAVIIDVAWVVVSSLYDGQAWSAVVPTVYQTIQHAHPAWQLQHVVGCTTAGVISSSRDGSSSSSATETTTTTTATTTTATGATTSSNVATSTLSSSTIQPHDTVLQPVEWEGLLGVSVTLMQLPDTQVQVFHVLGEDVPDDLTRVTLDTWQRAIGIVPSLHGDDENNDENDNDNDSVICLFPSPSFQTHLDDLIRGFSSNFGKTTTLMGAIASTVSSLSRARLFAYSGRGGSSNSDGSNFPATTTTFTEGCVGMIWQGDVQVRTLMASGAKPVGGIYRIVKGHDSTIQVIVLDQDATNELLPVELEQQNENSNDPLSKLQNEQDEDEDDDVPIKEDDKERRKRLMAEAYAKAAIPKPTLAEANFIMRALSDDEQAFMRKAILVGLERPRANMLSLSSNLQRSSTNGNDDDDDDDESNDNNENEYGDESKSEETVKSQGKDAGPSSVSATPSVPTTTLGRLAQGLGHGYTVHQVASAGMKDGSVTFALGSVTVQPGTRMRFFVRERAFAKKEIQALWMGYKKRVLDEQFSTMTNKPTTASPTSTKGSSPAAAAAAASFTPTGCFIFSTLDRGTKFFLGKPGFESRQVAQFLPTIPSIAGFFCNSVIGTLDDISATNPRLPNDSFLHGSASGYFLIGSKSKRPIYSPALAAAERKKKLEEEALAKANEAAEELRRERQAARAKVVTNVNMQSKAPRDENGELLLKRREIHAGRAISVSTVEWSVADKTAMPTSTLEGFMWDKETEVDRFRERVPLSNLVSQCRLSMVDPNMPKPRDFVGPIVQAAQQQSERFVIIPECKRKEPTTGSIRKRYDVAKLVKQFTLAGAPAISVNCDAVLFGGSLDDITLAREAAALAAVSTATLDSDGVVVPPILASDLILYPYQLYKLRLAGADAVNLLAGALANKDMIYLTKIAASLQLQCLVTVTSEVQLRELSALAPGSINGLIVSNRELEDFSFDMTGQQALDLLSGRAMADFQSRQAHAVPILVEGRVGIVSRPDDQGMSTASQYIKELKEAGAIGAIVGEGIIQDESIKSLESLQNA